MKKQDLIFILFLILVFSPFFLSESLLSSYKSLNKEHGLLMSFVKFGILATLGEVIGLRIKSGKYNEKGFGILPRVIVWGFLGIGIKIAFVIFYSGTPQVLEYLGVNETANVLKNGFSMQKLLIAFSISSAMNLIFAPIMMTLHKITDIHIISNGGTMQGFLKPINYGKIITELNWKVQWNFVFKKTIPFFWIPAHTITFMLPVEYQVLFAAILGIALGVILAIAGQISKQNK